MKTMMVSVTIIQNITKDYVVEGETEGECISFAKDRAGRDAYSEAGSPPRGWSRYFITKNGKILTKVLLDTEVKQEDI